MPNRKKIPASMRWSVFARDGFTCRYCGAQAGQDGVELHADHVVSVVDGGENTYDNLVTACHRCNGGKGARSLSEVPTASSVIERINANVSNLKEQAKAIKKAAKASRDMDQASVDLKCQAYDVREIRMSDGDKKRIHNLCLEFGAETVLEWYSCAACKNVQPIYAIRYVYGCARNRREKMKEEANA